MTHKKLIKRGSLWLRNKKKCGVVLLDRNGICVERPDIIGWHNWVSFLIEAKTSRQDFLADKKKSFRQMPEYGMGVFRYYLCPSKLISKDEIPEKWGLLWAYDNMKGIREIKKAEPFEPDYESKKYEIGLLVKALRLINWTAIIAPLDKDETPNPDI